MKLCVYGAGAIGGFLAVLMAKAGHEVSVVARGDHLKKIQADGLTLDFQGERTNVTLSASEDPADLGPQDCVFISVKAPALKTIAPRLTPLLGDDTPVVTAMNGIPWWFFNGMGEFDGTKLTSIDPGGTLEAALDKDRIIGCVLHIACAVPEPGLVVHAAQNRWILGEPDHQKSDRVTNLCDALANAGVGAEVADDIQKEVWGKLVGNMNFAPISILTGGTNDQLAGNSEIRRLMCSMIEEANLVAAHYGVGANIDAEERVDLGGGMVGFKTSMLQDFEKKRPVELDTIVRSIAEMGGLAGIDTPLIDTVLALASQKAKLAGIYTPPAS